MPYCAVPKCDSSAARLKSQLKIGEKGVTFHQFPLGGREERTIKEVVEEDFPKGFRSHEVF